jgi:hypothetical protein
MLLEQRAHVVAARVVHVDHEAAGLEGHGRDV